MICSVFTVYHPHILGNMQTCSNKTPASELRCATHLKPWKIMGHFSEIHTHSLKRMKQVCCYALAFLGCLRQRWAAVSLPAVWPVSSPAGRTVMIKSEKGGASRLPPEGVPGVTELPSCRSGPSCVFHLRALLIPPRLPARRSRIKCMLYLIWSSFDATALWWLMSLWL